jgi:heme/copper-type cytochrome/quinol oxidase subunit 2
MSSKNRKERAARRARQKTIRIVTFGVIAVLVLSTAGYLLASAFTPRTPPPAANTIDIAADMSGFSLKEIRIKAGEPVTIRLTSLDNQHHTDGGGKHQWAVDELGANVIAPPLGSNYVTFAPDKPGTYTFYCDVCCGGRANPSMQGTLIVEA